MNNLEFNIEKYFLNANRLRVQMHEIIKDIAKSYGLHGQELVFLFAIDHYENTTVGLLSEKLGIQQANVSKMIRNFDEKGLVYKVPDYVDTRTYTVILSEKATDLKEEIINFIKEKVNPVMDELEFNKMEDGIEEFQKLLALFD